MKLQFEFELDFSLAAWRVPYKSLLLCAKQCPLRSVLLAAVQHSAPEWCMRVTFFLAALCACSNIITVASAAHNKGHGSKGIAGVTTQMVSLFSPEVREHCLHLLQYTVAQLSAKSSSNDLCCTLLLHALSIAQEYELDRYAAAMAATEWLRKERDAIIRENTNPLAYLYLKATKGDHYARWMTSPLVSDTSRNAQHNFLLLAGRIITSCDLSISRFNQITCRV
eukprot:12091-Heterococcus_DN1.PRE.1